MRLVRTNPTTAFLVIGALYFATHTVLRVVLGGALEVDESEMVVMAQDLRIGYGPQLPLHNWLQVGFFALFGQTVFALTALKNLLIFATYVFFFLSLRTQTTAGRAALATLLIFLLPNLSWEAHRSGSHSISMYASLALTLFLFLRNLAEPRLSGFVLLGIAVGIGGLTKYNYWLFVVAIYLSALALPAFRAGAWKRGYLISAGIAALIVCVPYAWIAGHLDQALSSKHKIFDDDQLAVAFPWMDGLREMAIVSFEGLVLLAFVLIAARLPYGRRFFRLGPMPALSRLMLLASAVMAVAVAGLIIASDATNVDPRWLMPLYFALTLGLGLWVVQGVSDRVLRNVTRFCAVLAVLVLGGVIDLRLRGAGSDAVRIDVLVDRLAEQVSPPVRTIGYFYYPGNVALLRPDWAPLPQFPDGSLAGFDGTVVVFDPGDDAAVLKLLRNYGSDWTVPSIRRMSFDIPYRFEDTLTRRVNVALVSPAGS